MTGLLTRSGWLEGDILLNTDSEQEGEVYMGCAGGVDGEITMTINREDVPSGYATRELIIKGLKGGHSGCDIHTGRANANKLMGRFLATHAQDLGLRLGNTAEAYVTLSREACHVVTRTNLQG